MIYSDNISLLSNDIDIDKDKSQRNKNKNKNKQTTNYTWSEVPNRRK